LVLARLQRAYAGRCGGDIGVLRLILLVSTAADGTVSAAFNSPDELLVRGLSVTGLQCSDVRHRRLSRDRDLIVLLPSAYPGLCAAVLRKPF
jgi:hypothetical protein